MNNEKQKVILITGTAGFVGFHLAKRFLSEGYRVIGIDNMNDYYSQEMKIKRNGMLSQNENYRFHKVELADYEEVNAVIVKEEPQSIVHLAAQAGVRYSLQNPWAYINTNMMGTMNIFESAKNNKIKKVMYASSSSVYGEHPNQLFDEKLQLDWPVSLYAATKKANELLAHSYHRLYGMNMIGLRFFTIYGPWGRPDMAAMIFIHKMLHGKVIPVFGDGTYARSFTYIDDIIEGVFRLHQKEDDKYEIYNIGGAETHTVNNMIGLIEKHLGIKAEIDYQEVQLGDVPKTSADTSKIESVTGYSPTTTFDEGLKRMVGWCTENKEWFMNLKLNDETPSSK